MAATGIDPSTGDDPAGTGERPDRLPFSTRWEHDDVLVCKGELDADNRAQLHEALQGMLAVPPDHLIIDLEGVSMFDCAAIAEFSRPATPCGSRAVTSCSVPCHR